MTDRYVIDYHRTLVVLEEAVQCPACGRLSYLFIEEAGKDATCVPCADNQQLRQEVQVRCFISREFRKKSAVIKDRLNNEMQKTCLLRFVLKGRAA